MKSLDLATVHEKYSPLPNKKSSEAFALLTGIIIRGDITSDVRAVLWKAKNGQVYLGVAPLLVHQQDVTITKRLDSFSSRLISLLQTTKWIWELGLKITAKDPASTSQYSIVLWCTQTLQHLIQSDMVGTRECLGGLDLSKVASSLECCHVTSEINSMNADDSKSSERSLFSVLYVLLWRCHRCT